MSLRVLEVYGGGRGGGAARHLGELLPALGSLGAEVHLMSLGRDDLAPPDVRVHRVPGPLGALALVAALRPDVVHTHGVRANLFGRAAARLSDVPSVSTVHSVLASDYRSPLRAAAAELLDDATLPWADRLIAVSAFLRGYLVRRGARPEHVAVVPNGIPPAPAGDPALLRSLGAGPILAVAARLHPAKGVDIAVRALADLPGCTLAVFGEGPEEAALRHLAADLGVADRAHFLGYRPDLRALWAGADVGLAPSRAEGFGLAALEAMAQGVPVVAAAVGGLPDLLSSGGILVPPEDPPALAGGVRAALARRAALSLAARRRAAEFSLAASARATLAVLASV